MARYSRTPLSRRGAHSLSLYAHDQTLLIPKGDKRGHVLQNIPICTVNFRDETHATLTRCRVRPGETQATMT